MVNSTLLRLNINPKDKSSDHIPSMFCLYPQPHDTENIESGNAPVFGKALLEMKKYIQGKGSQGFAAAIMLVGETSFRHRLIQFVLFIKLILICS